jgi:hypothetical protein
MLLCGFKAFARSLHPEKKEKELLSGLFLTT